MTITISPETESKLREAASRKGQDFNTAVECLLLEKLDDDALERNGAIAGIQRGLDDVAAGRVRPLSEFIAQEKVRLALSDPDL